MVTIVYGRLTTGPHLGRMRSSDPYPSGQDQAHPGSNVWWACRQVLVWGAVAAVGYCAVGYRSMLRDEPVAPGLRPVVSPPASTAGGAANTIVYRADRRGHVVVDAAVNGAPVRFLLDTGATMVALSPADAAAAGISRASLSFTGRANTANGVVRIAPVTLREVRLGQLSVEDVSAAVIENLETSLLGMSFLKRLRSYEMRDGELTITW